MQSILKEIVLTNIIENNQLFENYEFSKKCYYFMKNITNLCIYKFLIKLNELKYDPILLKLRYADLKNPSDIMEVYNELNIKRNRPSQNKRRLIEDIQCLLYDYEMKKRPQRFDPYHPNQIIYLK
jgi:hypothetical protein